MPQPITPEQAERVTARNRELAAAMQRTAANLDAALTAFTTNPEVAASIARLRQALGVATPKPDRRSRPRRLWDAACDRLRWRR